MIKKNSTGQPKLVYIIETILRLVYIRIQFLFKFLIMKKFNNNLASFAFKEVSLKIEKIFYDLVNNIDENIKY